MWVKVCGITREEDARLAARLGAAAVGFVFWSGSPRAVDPDRARRIRGEIEGLVVPVGVFVNQPADHVASVASRVGLGAVQLHGEERPSDYERVGLPIIKAVPITAEVLSDGGTDDILVAGLPPGVTILVEGASRMARGGAGVRADWHRAALVARHRRTILAGGLTPDNVADAIAAVRPYGVDVSSGVESAPGVKEPTLLARFFEAIADDQHERPFR